MIHQIEVKKVENVKLQKDFIDLRNYKYKDQKIKSNIKQNRLLRKQARKIEMIQNFKERFKKWVQLIWVSLLVIWVVSHNFNFKFDIANANNIDIEETILNSALEQKDYTEQDIEQIVNEIDNKKYGKSISDEAYEEQVRIKEEEIRIYNEEANRIELDKKKEKQREEIKKVEKPIVKTETTFDIDKLAKSVALHETKDCTVWNSAKKNNCFWIMTWERGFREFKTYKTKEDSYKDFKRIWQNYYGWLPNYNKAKRYSWDDRTQEWLNNVLYFYNNDKI